MGAQPTLVVHSRRTDEADGDGNFGARTVYLRRQGATSACEGSCGAARESAGGRTGADARGTNARVTDAGVSVQDAKREAQLCHRHGNGQGCESSGDRRGSRHPTAGAEGCAHGRKAPDERGRTQTSNCLLAAGDPAEQMQVREAAAAENKTKGDAFLAENGKKDGVVVLPDGLQYKILAAGQGKKPVESDTVLCNYKGTFLDGTEFDSSTRAGKPVPFEVKNVIAGFKEVLQLMPVGSKWQVFVPSNLAYGERGAGGVIGPNATLIFEIELVSIQGAPEAPQPLSGKP